LHFKQPNPYINWDTLKVKVPTNKIPWPATEKRLAGVSAFGFSGTNAHVIISDFRLENSGIPESAKTNAQSDKPKIQNPKSKIPRASFTLAGVISEDRISLNAVSSAL
jgi:acyl transferase domain-containing protein